MLTLIIHQDDLILNRKKNHRVPLVKPARSHDFMHVFQWGWCCSIWSSMLCRILFVPLSFFVCIVCPSSTCGLWLNLWYLQTFHTGVLESVYIDLQKILEEKIKDDITCLLYWLPVRKWLLFSRNSMSKYCQLNKDSQINRREKSLTPSNTHYIVATRQYWLV